jgi:hypothetical protein
MSVGAGQKGNSSLGVPVGTYKAVTRQGCPLHYGSCSSGSKSLPEGGSAETSSHLGQYQRWGAGSDDGGTMLFMRRYVTMFP